MCLVCALNSKEMGVALPVMVLVYELLFHTPDFRSLRALIGWCLREGRMALLGALCVLIYLPGKLGALAWHKHRLHSSLHLGALVRQTPGTYLAHLVYRNSSTAPLGVTPLTPLGVILFYGVLIAIALWMRSRVVWFGLIFFAILCCRYRSSLLAWVSSLSAAGWHGALT